MLRCVHAGRSAKSYGSWSDSRRERVMQLVVCYFVVLVAESVCWPCVGESYLSSVISLVL